MRSNLSYSLAIGLATASASLAGDWNNPAGGVFSDANNWNPVGLPSGTLGFHFPAEYRVRFTGDHFAGPIHVTRGNVTFDLNGSTYEGGPVTVGGDLTNGIFSVTNGHIEGGGLQVGIYDGVGTFNLGAGASFNGFEGFEIGTNVNGYLNIRDGATAAGGYAYVGGSAAGFGNVLVSGQGSTWTTGDLTVGGDGTGYVTIENGGTLRSNGFGGLGGSAGANGTVVVAGQGSNWTHNSSSFEIGSGGHGTLLVQNGASVHHQLNVSLAQSTGSTATVIIDGAGSLWHVGQPFNGAYLEIGTDGDATIDVRNGGRLRVDGSATLSAGGFAGNSAVNVDGSGSRFDATDIYLHASEGGAASLNVSGGARVTAEYLQINPAASLAINAGTVTASSFITNYGDLRLNGPGAVLAGNVESEGLISGTGRIIGNVQNSPFQAPGEIRVTGSEHLVVTGEVQNSSRINLLNGGTLEMDSLSNFGTITGRGTLVARSANSNAIDNLGRITFSGGEATVLGDVYNNDTGVIVVSGNGVATFHDDVVHNGAEIRTSAGSTSIFLGNVSGAGAFTGTGTTIFEGDLSPGNSPAAVTFEGDVVLAPTSTLHIELGGATTAAQQYDQLIVAGKLTLDGTLAISLLDGYRPSASDTFELFTSDQITGQFAVVNGYVGDGLNFDVSFTDESVSLIGEQAGPGDANLDGSVDIEDLTALATSYGGTNDLDWLQGDFDHDGDVDLVDLTRLATHYSTGQAQAFTDFQALTSVPEPACAGVFALGLLASRRRRV